MNNITATATALSSAKREGMIQIYSDFHKDAYGFRPRYNYALLSDEQLIKDFERFAIKYKESQEAEEMDRLVAEKSWYELIEKTIQLGAKDKETALSWIIQAESFYNIQCIEVFIWKYGMFYKPEGKALMEEICTLMDKNNWWAK